jgi:hypothetical protein
VLIFYADEFGDHSMALDPSDASHLKAGVSEHFVLATVGVQANSRKPLAHDLFELKRRHFGDEIVGHPWGESELKGRFLFRAARSAANGKVLTHPVGYAALDTVDKVDALIGDLALIFAKHRPLVFAAAIDKNAILASKPSRERSPLGVAYAYIHQRIALGLEKLYSGDAAIIVADQQTQHETFFRSGQMNAVRDEISAKLWMQPDFNLVLDKPLWVDTELSSWDREIIQLADIVAYTIGECMKRGEPPTEACYLWEYIRPCLAVHWSSGQLTGAGVSVYPKSAKVPAL